MQQITQRSGQGSLPGPCRSALCLSARVCSRQHCSSQAPARLAARARLPHMDEELEHMQWQLDKRTQDRTAGSGHEHTSKHKAAKRRMVFHDSHSSQHQRHHHLHHHRRPHTRPGSVSGSNSGLDISGSSSSSDEAAAAAVGAALSQPSPAQEQEQQPMQAAVCAGLQEEQFYCLHLDHVAAAQDLHKAQERLAKHIQQDGGCVVSAAVEQASMLTHLLLLLQHKQLHRKSGHWGDDMVQLLQPLSCEQQQSEIAISTPGIPTPAAVAAAAAGLEDSTQAVSAAAAGQHSRGAVVRSGGTRSPVSGSACPVEELSFFTTFLPLHTLLSVERSSAADAVCGATEAGDAQQHTAPGTPGYVQAAEAASMQSSSGVDSSCDDSAAAAAAGGHQRINSSSGSNGRHSQHSKSIGELLKAAGSSAASALLSDAAGRDTLRCAHVGSHGDAAGIAASIAAAVSAGQLLALHVKHQDAAHAVAYCALELAGRVLHGGAGQQGFGVLLVQGQSHEHVHARTHGHGSAGGADLQQGSGAGRAAGAAAEVLQHHQQKQHGRVATDASMDVGGFGAAFYGLGGWGDDRSGQQGVLHRHGQEVWLCIVPLGVGA